MATGSVPRVSVLLPVGEGAAPVADAAAGFFDQTFVDCELVVVHDGSAAREVAAIADAGGDRVITAGHPAQGVARALAAGLAIARGRWVVALSGRERLVPHALAARLERAEASPGAVGVIGPVPDEGAGPGAPGLLERLFSPVLPAGGDALVRVEAARAAGGFDPSFRFAHHLDLWLRLLAHGELLVADDTVVSEASRGRRPGEIEAAATRVERTAALAGALSSLRASALVRDAGLAPGEDAARVAAAAVRSGLPELRPYAVELVREAQAAGFPVDVAGDPAWAPLLREAPALANAAAARPGLAVSRAPAWLRVALEVHSLDRGGLESVVADLALSLGDEGIEPVVVCTDRGGARARELRAAGVEVRVLCTGDRPREIGAILQEREIDLLNPHYSTVGTRAAASLGIPVVPTLHNAYAWIGASVVDELRALDPLIAGYTAVSRFVADFSATRFGIAPERICVIPNAYRAGGEGRTIDRAAARRALDLPDSAELVLQLGRVDPVKCQLALVEAIERLRETRPHLRAWIAGAVGDAGYAARVEERIVRAGVADVVTLLGQRDDVDLLLAAADVLAMPSILEGLSLSVIEALAAGVPAVLTRTGDAAWLLGETEAGTEAIPGALIDGPEVDPLRVEGEEVLRLAAADHPSHAPALAAALEEVLGDLEAMRARARRRAAALEQALAPPAIVARYADVFARVVVERSRYAGEQAAARARADRARARRGDASRDRLRAAVARASGGLDATMRLARERERALWQATALQHELAETRREADAARDVAGRVLDKLRLTHRLRGAASAALRRLRRNSPPQSPT